MNSTHTHKTRLPLAAIAGLCLAGSAQAALLSVDFQHTTIGSLGVTQSGFQAFENDGSGSASETRTFSTVAGDVNVTMSGHQFGLIEGFFVRGGLSNGGSLTVADIYNDFVFSNGPIPNGSLSMTLALAGAGIAANTPYLLTFYSFDPLASQGSHSVSFDGASGTAGSAPALTYDSSVNPTTDDQYATTGIFTSDGAGVLTISLADNWTGATESTGIRLNGFVVGDPGASAFAITEIVYSPDDDMVTLTWISRPGAAYAVKFSTDMTNWDADLDDGVAADAGETTTRTFGIGGLASADGKLFFRIERQ